MFKKINPFVIRTLSSTHVGSGSDLGFVDLPIQREKHTGYPKIEASSLKGSLREALENVSSEKKKEFITQLKSNDNNLINLGEMDDILNYSVALNLVFGYDDDSLDEKVIKAFEDNKEFAGAIGFSDARILLFPVRALKDVFVWITSPNVLKNFERELRLAGFNDVEITIPAKLSEKQAIISSDNLKINNKIILEEYSFDVFGTDDAVASKLSGLLNEPQIKNKLVIVNDDVFSNFVQNATEVITRTKIDNVTGTVAKGALFNEEYLPPETFMYFLVFSSPILHKAKENSVFKNDSSEEKVFEFFRNNLPDVIQIGGNATLGKGIVEINEIKEA